MNKNKQRQWRGHAAAFSAIGALMLLSGCSGGGNSEPTAPPPVSDSPASAPSPTTPASSPTPPVDPPTTPASSPTTPVDPPTTPASSPPTTPAPTFKSLQDAAANLRPGEWYQLPGKNKLADVLMTRSAFAQPPYSLPPSDVGAYWGNGSSSVVTAWGGGAVDDKKMLVWGGGHADYGGNEIYTFDLDTWTWARENNPSLYKAVPCAYNLPAGRCETVDGKPVSVHSYQGIEYIPTTGQYWTGGGADFSQSGGFTDQSHALTLNTLAWSRLPNMPWPGPMISAWDPVSEKVLIVAGGGGGESGSFATFNPKTNTFQNTSGKNWSVGGSGGLDPETRKFVVMPDGRPGTVYVFDLAGIDLKNSTAGLSFNRFDYQNSFMEGNLSTPFAPPLKGNAGYAYDPVKKVLTVWDGGQDIWTLNTRNWTWKKAANLAGGPTKNNVSQGVFGRWRYLPAYGIYLGFDNVNQSPWIYKLP